MHKICLNLLEVSMPPFSSIAFANDSKILNVFRSTSFSENPHQYQKYVVLQACERMPILASGERKKKKKKGCYHVQKKLELETTFKNGQ